MPAYGSVVLQREADVSARQRKPLECFVTMGVFSGFRLQKFTPCRCVEVEVMYFHRGARGKSRRLGREQMTVFCLYPTGVFSPPPHGLSVSSVKQPRYLASASPRKPRLATFCRSSNVLILLVAWRVSASADHPGNSGPIIRDTDHLIRPGKAAPLYSVASASTLFSSSSLSAEAGRPIPSPAEI